MIMNKFAIMNTISVVIPLYNKGEYIIRAVESVLNQSVHVDEIIVVDDGSTDGSAELVCQFKSVRLISQVNSGVSAARNAGIAAALSSHIAFLDADDFWERSFIYNVKKLMLSYPQADVFCTNYGFIRADGLPSAASIKKVPQDSGLIDDYFLSCCLGDLPITSSSVCISKTSLSSVGGFPVGMKMGEDQVVWSKLASRYLIAFCSDICVYYDLSVNDSACHVNLILEPAPQIATYRLLLTDTATSSVLKPSIKKLLKFTVLSCCKNNILVGRHSQARELLLNSRDMACDFYFLIGLLMTFTPSKLFRALYDLIKKRR